jgi:hypothetical protein
MTKLLEEAFQKASKLSFAEQDLLAGRLLAELEAEDEFDRRIAATSDKLAVLAEAALAEYEAGLTREVSSSGGH